MASLAQNSAHVQALADGLLLPVALSGEFNAGAGRDLFFRAAPLAVGGGGGVNTDTLLAAGALRDARPSLADAPGVTSVGAQQLLNTRAGDSIAYVSAGALLTAVAHWPGLHLSNQRIVTRCRQCIDHASATHEAACEPLALEQPCSRA